MARRLHADRRGISPVVATVILVAVTIVVAVAVAYWMGGLTAIYTRFEKLEITSAYADPVGDGYKITLNLKNSGSADATIDNILINGKPLNEYDKIVNVTSTNKEVPIVYNGTNKKFNNLPVKAGGSVTLYIYISDNSEEPFTPGTSIDVKLHTAAGQEYPKTITLP